MILVSGREIWRDLMVGCVDDDSRVGSRKHEREEKKEKKDEKKE